MKTKLYSLLTGLLMAACITSYGQEIVSTFSISNREGYGGPDIQECTDGSILTGIRCFTDYDYNYVNRGFLVCKSSHEGVLIDSVRFYHVNELTNIPEVPDQFVLYGLSRDSNTNNIVFTMIFTDASLNVTNEIIAPVNEGIGEVDIDDSFISPTSDFIISFWVDDVFHIMKIGLDGTIIAENEIGSILPPNWSNMHPADSALSYSSFGIFNESPMQYYKIGGYVEEGDAPNPLIAYIFDDNLNVINQITYCYLNENDYCDWGNGEHIIPFEKSTFKESYLSASHVQFSNGRHTASLIKYDYDNNPLVVKDIESLSFNGYGNPIQTIAVNENTIYHVYNTLYVSVPLAVGLVCLDSDLNIQWNIVLPGGMYNWAYGNCLKVLENGDVAVGFTSYSTQAYECHVHIIHNGYDATPENAASETPFVLNPNPVKDAVILNFAEGNEPATVAVYDLTGRLVGVKSENLESIDMNTMSAGVYTLRVTMKDGTSYHEKIIKE